MLMQTLPVADSNAIKTVAKNNEGLACQRHPNPMAKSPQIWRTPVIIRLSDSTFPLVFTLTYNCFLISCSSLFLLGLVYLAIFMMIAAFPVGKKLKIHFIPEY